MLANDLNRFNGKNALKGNKVLFIICILFFHSVFSQERMTPFISHAIYFDISPPFKDIQIDGSRKTDPVWKDGAVKNYFQRKNEWDDKNQRQNDPSVQNFFGKSGLDSMLQDFDGIANADNEFNMVPPDPCGDIGPNHYVQIVNLSFAVFSRNGDSLLGPLPSGVIWYGLPYSTGNGDGVVLYDEQTDRWFISQFSFPNGVDGPFYQMIAVSQTPDPTGSWYRWEYLFTELPDYPKFGIWPDGYYMSCNRFAATTLNFNGTGAIVYDRTAMLAGDPDARMVMFTLSASNNFLSLLPADCDGSFPSTNSPNYFIYVTSTYLGMFDFLVNWDDPSTSTFNNFRKLEVNPFYASGMGISQKETSQKLDPYCDRLMYRLQYREFNDHKSMVVNHTVSVGSHYGIRWYELRKTIADWSIFQQSTYSPDTNSRWMGSIAMDSSGNIALGFSISSPVIYPSIHVTGRMKHDPLGQMTIAEQTIINGSGSQTGSWSSKGRWGDYSSMNVDPVQPQTFWYTQEYYPVTSPMGWQTRIGALSFSGILSIQASSSLPSVCAGGSVQLNVDTYGVLGNTIYTWSSAPPEFASNLKNPVVFPVVNTKYIVQVTNGEQSKRDTLRISVIPSLSLSAGKDTSYSQNISKIPLKGRAVNYITTKWATSGDGTFDDPYSLTTDYTPGIKDRSADSVNFKLTAYPQIPCSFNSSVKHIVFVKCGLK